MGTEAVTLADTDYVSGTVEIQFSRPELVPIYVTVAITQGEGYPSDGSTEAAAARESAIIAAVVAYAATLESGDNTSGFKVAAYVQANAGIPGIDDIEVEVDTVDPPASTGTLIAAIREQFTIDDQTTDITVTGA